MIPTYFKNASSSSSVRIIIKVRTDVSFLINSYFFLAHKRRQMICETNCKIDVCQTSGSCLTFSLQLVFYA